MPWNKARSWIETGKVFLDGNPVSNLGQPVRAGQRIELRMSAPKRRQEPSLDPRAVVYFDNDLVVVNKPAGLMTVPHRNSEESQTLDRLTQAYLRIHDAGTDKNQASLGVVHRIDKETSGLVVFTRNYRAMQGLSQQFRAHRIERLYLALVHGLPQAQTVRSRLVRDAGGGTRGSVAKGAANQEGELLGREAVTHVEVMDELGDAALVACRIETGRTHQIRIHLSEIGHPILGEKVYIRNYAGRLMAADRVMLHATELGFLHPGTGEPVKWTQPLPPDFEKRLAALRRKA